MLRMLICSKKRERKREKERERERKRDRERQRERDRERERKGESKTYRERGERANIKNHRQQRVAQLVLNIRLCK
jgi:hypothetical protein